MDEIIASVDDFKFDIEIALDQQLGIQPLPFPGMDKSGSAICDFFISSGCHRGQLCPLRHISGDRMVVCKHWLRGLCKKGDDCEFLHQYDMEKMPECYFYNKYGQCSNKECPFLHLDPEAKIKDCPWYDRGFCKHGPGCKNRHVRRIMCVNYLCGFCPDGKKCKFSHPSFDVPITADGKRGDMAHIICHACGEAGHKSSHCAVARRLAAEAVMRSQQAQQAQQPPQIEETSNQEEPSSDANQASQHQQNQQNDQKPAQFQVQQTQQAPSLQQHQVPPHQQQFHQMLTTNQQPGHQQNEADVGHQHAADQDSSGQQDVPAAYIPFGKRPLEFVTCFKCRGKGHYANRCPFSGNSQAGIPKSFRSDSGDVRPNMEKYVQRNIQVMLNPNEQHHHPRHFNPNHHQHQQNQHHNLQQNQQQPLDQQQQQASQNQLPFQPSQPPSQRHPHPGGSHHHHHQNHFQPQQQLTNTNLTQLTSGPPLKPR